MAFDRVFGRGGRGGNVNRDVYGGLAVYPVDGVYDATQ